VLERVELLKVQFLLKRADMAGHVDVIVQEFFALSDVHRLYFRHVLRQLGDVGRVVLLAHNFFNLLQFLSRHCS